MSNWAIIAHGGAKDILPEDDLANREGLKKAIAIGSHILSDGGTALNAVEETVKELENNPAYNAGLYGCARNEQGNIELTASIMDGSTLDIGAVAGLQDIEHPVSVARALLKDKAIFLIGEGAKAFARGQGFPIVVAPVFQTSATACDTVGCVARDKHGNFAVATSTGGLDNTRVGRVGDVPLPGCGFYADNTRGAVSMSGEGETIARVLLASEFLHLLDKMLPDDAARQAIKSLDRIKGEAGLIAITQEGRFAWAHNSAHFAVAMARESYSNSRVFLKKEEEK